MSIAQNNIAEFITFLYKKRKNIAPPAALLEGWKALSNEEIAVQLDGLFASWGLGEVEKKQEINAFFKETLFTPKPQAAPKMPPPPPPRQQPVMPVPRNKPGKWKRGIWVLAVIVLLLAGYTGIQYMSYARARYIYTITDNVSVRNEEKEIVARLDLFEVKSNIPSYQKMKAIDDKIYYRGIDNTDKTYPCRKVLLQEGNFMAYLFNRPGQFGYVNTNYVVDNVKEFNLYQTAFKEIKTNKAENADLKALYRKIIIGSMSLDAGMENKYIAIHAAGIPRSALDATFAVIKQPVTENVKYVIIAGMSDGYYYSFEGDIKSNNFIAPQKIMVINAEGQTEPLSGNYRFMNKDGNIVLYDCIRAATTNYEAKKDANGKITAFEYKEPSLLQQIFE